MKVIYYLIKHNRGNHSANHVYFNGYNVFEGTKKECKVELVRVRKFCKDKFHNTSTDSKMMDFVSYEMSDIFFVVKKDGQINWA